MIRGGRTDCGAILRQMSHKVNPHDENPRRLLCTRVLEDQLTQPSLGDRQVEADLVGLGFGVNGAASKRSGRCALAEGEEL